MKEKKILFDKINNKREDMKEIFHKAAEFHNFDWSKLVYGSFKTNGDNYSFVKGGIHYPNGEGWQITVYSGKNDLHRETWELPKAISDMLDHQAEYTEKETKRKIGDQLRVLMGLNNNT